MMHDVAECIKARNSGESMSRILHTYSALVSPRNLTICPTLHFSEVHDFLLADVLLNDHLNRYPPAQAYQKVFWKWAMQQLERLGKDDEDVEIDERIYRHYMSLVSPMSADLVPSNTYITYYWRHPEYSSDSEECLGPYERITLLQSCTTIAAGTTGLRTWRAGLVLGQYLIANSDLVAHRTILELGSGTGFLGILIANLQLRSEPALKDGIASGHPTIFLTDVNLSVLDRCQYNVKLPCNQSSLHSSIEYRLLDWFDAISAPEKLKSLLVQANAEIVLGADIVFDPALVPPLVGTLAAALSLEHTKMALIALTVRNKETFSHFMNEIQCFLAVEEVEHDVPDNFISLILDQIDVGLEVKILRVTRQT